MREIRLDVLQELPEATETRQARLLQLSACQGEQSAAKTVQEREARLQLVSAALSVKD